MFYNKKMDLPSKSKTTGRPNRSRAQYSNMRNSHTGTLETSQRKLLERVRNDRVIQTRPDEDRRRRTIIVERRKGNFGFTIQTYGIHHKRDGEIELITYVDYVEYDGPAYRAGMRPGDVILSINGQDMERVEHQTLVQVIKTCPHTMRMVVLFEDCVHKVELHMKYLQLHRILQQKKFELQQITEKERQVIQILQERGARIPPSPLYRSHPSPAQSSRGSSSGPDTVETSWSRSSFLSYASSNYATLPKVAKANKRASQSTRSTPRGSWDRLESTTNLSDYSAGSSARTSPTPSRKSGHSTEDNLEEEDEDEKDEVTRL